jgi:hypothetical protein
VSCWNLDLDGDPELDDLPVPRAEARHASDKLSTVMSQYFRVEYREIRRRWKERIIVQNQNVRVLVDGVFARLHALMFDPTTETLRPPRGVSRPTTRKSPPVRA